MIILRFVYGFYRNECCSISTYVVGIAPAKTHRVTFVAMPCKGGSTFLESVAASFNNVAVQEEGEEDKWLSAMGWKGGSKGKGNGKGRRGRWGKY